MERSEDVTGVIPELLTYEVDRVIEEIKNNVLKLRDAVKLREILNTRELIKKILEYRCVCFYAVDSSFTTPPIEIAGGYLSVIQVAELLAGETCSSSPVIRAYVEYHPNKDLTGVRARLHEREALVGALDKKKRGELKFDIALVDGEILYRGELEEYIRSHTEEEDIVNEVSKLTIEALKLAEETKTPIVGVMKRSYSRDVSVINGLDIKLSDRVLMAKVLEVGEYYVLGNYNNVLEKLKTSRETASPGKVNLKWLNARVRWLESLKKRYGPYSERVNVVFYKPGTPPNTLAVKVEIYNPSSWSTEAVLGAVIGVTGSTGFPVPIDYVDRLSSLTAETRDLIYNLVKSKLSVIVNDAEVVELLMRLINPQKPI